MIPFASANKAPESDDERKFDPDVLKAELKQIYLRRVSRGQEDIRARAITDLERDHKSVLPLAQEARLVGLALSGGGIRSATFNLGLLQGLARLGLLSKFDYLSTVSGGGYIGSWLTAWLRREGDFAAVESTMAADSGPMATTPAQAPPGPLARPPRDPINHLRSYSNYLAPRLGFFSMDRWGLWANYLRNVLLNALILLPLLIIFLLCVRFFMWLYYPWSEYLDEARALPESHESLLDPSTIYAMTLLSSVGLFALLFSLVGLFYGARMVTTREVYVEAYDNSRWTPGRLILPVLGLVVFAFVLCSYAPYNLSTLGIRILPEGLTAWVRDHLWEFEDRWKVELIWITLATVCLGVITYLLAYAIPPHGGETKPWWNVVAVIGAGLAGGPLLYGVHWLLHQSFVWDGSVTESYQRISATAWLLTVGTPLVLLTLVLIVSIGIGLLKEQIREELKEWWSSVCARLLFHAVCWLVLFALALYAAPLLLWSGPYLTTFVTSGWLVSVIAGVVAGRSAKTGRSASSALLEWFAWLGPYLFLGGFLVAVSLMLHWAVDRVPNWQEANEDVWLRRLEPFVPNVSDHQSRLVNRKGSKSANDSKADEEIVLKEVRSIEHHEVVSMDDILKQMYWVGFLNVQKGFVPHVEKYNLKKAVHYHNLLHQVKPQDKGKPTNLIEWKESLASEYLPDEASKRKLYEAIESLSKNRSPRNRYLLRFHLVQWAKEVRLWPKPTDALAHFARRLGLMILGVTLVMLLAVWRVDVNLMSLQKVYGNRLVRCYLGASRPIDGPREFRKRQPDPITGFDPNDDLYLDELQQNSLPLPRKHVGNQPSPYTGPYLIVNASLNLVHASRLDWQERKAESFILTPRFCGSVSTGYRCTDVDPTSHNAYAGRLSLGSAVTISGAAASPNMGYHSSPAVTALLTVFNARLGSWLGNPNNAATWYRSGPSLGFLQLFLELFGMTSSQGNYVFLSDGGHFENLGVYELVRRRCQYVVVSDAGNDGGYTFEDLSNLIHKCRVDFGIEIELTPDCLRPSERGLCSWHCAVGRIRYDLVDPKATPGILVYVKPSLTGDEPTDVLQYRERNSDFPHDPTMNQFFTESRFESYRALGQHVADAVFAKACADVKEDKARDVKTGIKRPASPAVEHGRWCLDFFTSLVRQWYALPPKYESSFLESTSGFVDIQKALRTQPELWRLSLEIYPELDPNGAERAQAAAESPEQAVRRRSSEVHLINQMLQVMENAWLSLDLESHYKHPLNRGWLDVFHRWTHAPTVRELWPVVRSEYARGFAAFCEKQMGMGAVVPLLVPMGTPKPPDWERFLLELEDQVPKRGTAAGALNPYWDWDAWIREAQQQPVQKPRGWYIFPKNESTMAGRTDANDKIPCGVIVLHAPPGETTYELFVWMRGAYRNSGLGRLALRDVLYRQLKNRKDIQVLRASLPSIGMKGAGAKIQESMWLTFFYHHGFQRSSSPGPGGVVFLEWRNS